jgi:hypothetical protein
MLAYYFRSGQRRRPTCTANFYGRCLPRSSTGSSRLRSTIISSPNPSDLSATTHLNPSELTMSSTPHSSTQSPIVPPTHMLWWICGQPVRYPVERRAEDSYYLFFLRWASSRKIEVGWHIMDSSSGAAALQVTCVPICA